MSDVDLKDMSAKESVQQRKMLYVFLKGLIAMHRYNRVQQPNCEAANKLRSSLGELLNQLSQLNKNRVKQASSELAKMDLSSKDDLIIEALVRRVTR